MLVFLIAAPNLLLISWLAIVLVSSGDIAQGLPFASLLLMSVSYFVAGAREAFVYLRGFLK